MLIQHANVPQSAILLPKATPQYVMFKGGTNGPDLSPEKQRLLLQQQVANHASSAKKIPVFR